MRKINIKTVSKATLLFLCFFIAIATNAHTKENKTLRIATSSSIPPYFIKNNHQGIVAEIIKSSFESQGYQVTFTYQSNNIIQKNLLTKHVVGAFNFPKKKSSKLYYTKPIVYYENIVASRSKDNYEFHSLSDLRGLRVGTFENALNFIGNKLKDTIQNFKSYSEYKNQEEQVKALLNNEVDAIIIEKNIFDYFYQKLLSKNPSNQNQISKSYIFPRSERPLAFLNRQLRDDFNKGFKQVKESGEYYKILHKYID